MVTLETFTFPTNGYIGEFYVPYKIIMLRYVKFIALSNRSSSEEHSETIGCDHNNLSKKTDLCIYYNYFYVLR